MKISSAEQHAQKELEKIYEPGESRRLAEMILEECTGKSRSQLLFNKNLLLSAEEENKFTGLLQRLATHEPIQYVLNKAWFYNMALYVDNNVLIPRPETEELLEWIIHDVKAGHPQLFTKGTTEADATTQLKILDVGTGSGCIALALKKHLPKAEVWGCDVSDEALNVARRNGAALNIRVDFQGINFLNETAQQSLPSIDLLVSNPPYIPVQDKATMHPNVLLYEPHTALFVPNDDALVFYKAIAVFAGKKMAAGSTIYLEIHEELGENVVAFYKQAGFAAIELKKDMQGKDRMVKVTI